MNIGRLFGMVRRVPRRTESGPPPVRKRIVRAIIAGVLALGVFVLLPVDEAAGQTPSTLDTLRVVSVNAGPGDTFFVDIYMRNVDTLGAYNFRIRYNPAVISPLTDTTINGTVTTVNVEAAQQLRGVGMWDQFGAGLPSTGVLTFAAVDLDSPPPFFLPGRGADVRMRWLVRASATPQAASIAFENDPTYPQSYNTMTDYHGGNFKRPTLVSGTVNINTGTGDPPVISNCPGPFTVNQTQLVQFSVTATDPNGDNLSLTASNMPLGATFSPSNPVTGNTSVTGTFQWIPSTSQTGNFLVSFRATDSPGGLSSSYCTVSITVQEGVTGNPPEIGCQASTVTIDQGQLVEFNVSASDPDGDTLTVTASNLPLGATFTPSNPLVGPSPRNGVFHWTPTFTQSGVFTITFQVEDVDGNQDYCTTTIIVNEIAVDQLFTTSAAGQRPQGGVAGTPNVVVPIDLVTSQAVYGIQLDFIYDPAVFTATAVQASDRLLGFSVYDNLGEEAGRIRILAFDLTGASIGNGESSVLFNVVGNMNAGVTPGSYPIEFEDAWESINPDPEYPSVPLATTNGILVVDNLGDANLDTRIDVADVVSVIGYILSNFEFNLRQFVAGDVTEDALLDVFDVQGILNLIFGLPISPTPGQPGDDGPATVEFVYDASDGPYGAYLLTTDTPVDIAGVQLDVVYDSKDVGLAGPETMSASSGLDLTYKDDGNGHLVALLIDPTNDARIPTGRSTMLRIPLTRVSSAKPIVKLNSIKLAASDAAKIEVAGTDPLPKTFSLLQNYPNPFNPSTTIAFALGGDGQGGSVRVRLDIYNVLGQRVTTLVDGTLPPGRYEYQWNGRDGAGQQVASGLYFYRLTTGEQSETKKMVLLK